MVSAARVARAQPGGSVSPCARGAELSGDGDVNDLRRRVANVENGLERVRETRPSDSTVRAWTQTLQEQVNAVRVDIGRLDARVQRVDDNIDAFRETWRAEGVARRNQVLAIIGTIAAGVVVALVLAGIGAIG